jgi:hypothetical protein
MRERLTGAALRRRRQRGQAITELALIAPLFAGLLVLLALWARLTLIRLELIHVTRDAAILLAGDADHWTASPSVQEDDVRKLAERHAFLDPRQIRLELEPMPLPLGLSLGNGGFATLLTGKKICVHYHVRLGGLAGQAFPQGLDMTEWGAIQGDPWQNPALSIFQALTGG